MHFKIFSFLPLYPSDCLSLAYYARLKLRSMKEESLIDIQIGHCSITDVGLETFSNEMSKGINEVILGDLSLSLSGNPIITDRANTSITTLLSRCHITLLSCMLPDTTSTTLKCIINGLNNSSLDLEELILTGSHINITHVHYLILLVQMNSNLHILNLSYYNDLNKAIPLLSSALIHSKIE